MQPKRVLVLGATGAMARYMIPYLAERGCQIDGIALDAAEDRPNVHYIQGNAKDPAMRDEYLSRRYDAIVDYLTYRSFDLPYVLPRMLDCTDHYVFLSSGRVYDNLEIPVRETSPRLIDTSKDPMLLNSDDYCIYRRAAKTSSPAANAGTGPSSAPPPPTAISAISS